MYISENAVMMVGLGLMFMIAGFAGVYLGMLLTRLTQATTLAPAMAVPTGLPAPIRQSIRRNGHWRSHVFKQAPYATIEDYIAQLNSRGIRVTSVTQSDGDRFCTVYGEEWIPG